MIASDTRALRSMFRPESIVLCDPSRPESFAEAIIDLYQHPEKRAQMVANLELFSYHLRQLFKVVRIPNKESLLLFEQRETTIVL
jgi:hypothetical protein